MMKKVVKITITSLCILFFDTDVICAEHMDIAGVAGEQSQESQPFTLLERFGPGEVYLQEQSKSLEAYFEMQEQIDAYSNEYQDTYAGMYLDDDGKLNVLVVGNHEEVSAQNSVQIVAEQKKTMDMYEALADTCADEGQDIKIQEAAYSLEQLENIQEELMAHASELGIINSAIIQRENIIQVGYQKDNGVFDANKVTEFAGGKRCLKFVESGGFQKNSSAIPNGSMAYYGILGVEDPIKFTIACGAKKGGKYGFVTAGHVGKVGQGVVCNGQVLGTITHRNFGRQSDVAFIERASNDLLLTNQYKDHKAYTTGKDIVDGALYVSGGFPEGTQLNKYGFKTGITWGRIISRYCAFTYEGVTMTNMVEADYKAVGGDSGGPVRVERTHNGATYRYCAGIHSGLIEYTKSDGTKYYTAAYSDMDYAKGNLGFVGFYNTTDYQ